MEYGLGKVEESVELWFSDNQTDHVKVSVKVEKQLFGEQTDFQDRKSTRLNSSHP